MRPYPIKESTRVLVIGYASNMDGGVVHVTKILLNNIHCMELHPSLYCYKPRFRALALYIKSVLSFILKLLLNNCRPESVLILVGSSGDVIRALPYIWISKVLKKAIWIQYHSNYDALFDHKFIGKNIKKNLNLAHKHFFLSKRLKREFEQNFSLDVDSEVIPNALDQKWIKNRPIPYNERHRDIVFLGRWSEEKGIYDLLKCMKRFSGNLTCEIYSDHLPKETHQNCRFFPWVDEGAVLEIMKSARLLVLPSYAEAYPTVLLEAAACGTPFVTSDLQGPIDIAEESRAGLIFKRGNIDEFQKCIADILSDKEAWERLSKAGYNWAKTLSTGNIVKQWMKHINYRR